MPTFIDESGESGPRIGSSRHYRLAAVWFGSDAEVDQYLEAVSILKTQLNISQDEEFHFARISHQRRLRFYQAIAEIPFRFTFHSFDKDLFDRGKLRKEQIVKSTIARMVACLVRQYLEHHLAGNDVHERVFFDRCDDPKFVKTLQSEFNSVSSQSKETQKFIKSVKPKDSEFDPRIQLADMICSGASRYADGESIYFDFFRSKAIEVATIEPILE